MKRFCLKPVDGFKCLLFKGHKGSHSKRQAPEEPSLDWQLKVLETAAMERPHHLWSWIWTFSNGGFMTWMVDHGLLTEELREGCDYTYGGFSWSELAPSNRITQKGTAMLNHHAPAEW